MLLQENLVQPHIKRRIQFPFTLSGTLLMTKSDPILKQSAAKSSSVPSNNRGLVGELNDLAIPTPQADFSKIVDSASMLRLQRTIGNRAVQRLVA